MSLPPGPRLPAIAQALWLQRDPVGMLEAARRRHGDRFTLALPGIGRIVVVADPSGARALLEGDSAVFRAGEATGRVLPFLGPGSVLLADGDVHLQRRRRLLPLVHGAALRDATGWIAAIAGREVERWPVGEPFPLLPRMRAIAFEVIAGLAADIHDPERLAELHRRLRRLVAFPVGPALWLPFLRRELRGHGPAAALRRRAAAVDDLLRERTGGDPELSDELRALLVVGHETTAAAMAWGVERLVRHPAVLRHLLERLADGDDRYLGAVVAETLRVRPPVVDAVRRLAEPAELDGLPLPAGTIAAAAPLLLHRREELHGEPERFRPERFVESTPDPAGWIPFGGGVRRCLGASLAQLEMGTVLSEVLPRVRLRPARPEAERMRLHGTALVPHRGAEVVVEQTLVP